MIVKEFKSFFKTSLSTIYPQTEIDTFFFLLMEEYLGFQRIDTVLKSDFVIKEGLLLGLKEIVKRLQHEEPIQYILKKTEFYGLPFEVDKNTLIPRPETEELVAWVLDEARKLQEKGTKNLTILDIGTGTGCIPISLAKNLQDTTIFAMDVSSGALRVAKKNTRLNKVSVEFLQQDILQLEKLPRQYDIIISNPPYVRELEKVEIKNNVLQNEPHLALFVSDDNPLIFYKKIADLAKNHLTKKGILFFEINQYLGKDTIEMLQEKKFDAIEMRKDVFGNDRMIKAKK